MIDFRMQMTREQFYTIAESRKCNDGEANQLESDVEEIAHTACAGHAMSLVQVLAAFDAADAGDKKALEGALKSIEWIDTAVKDYLRRVWRHTVELRKAAKDDRRAVPKLAFVMQRLGYPRWEAVKVD